jgi:hypothetical protein
VARPEPVDLPGTAEREADRSVGAVCLALRHDLLDFGEPPESPELLHDGDVSGYGVDVMGEGGGSAGGTAHLLQPGLVTEVQAGPAAQQLWPSPPGPQ